MPEIRSNASLVIVREGHGEKLAIDNLVVRTIIDLGLHGAPFARIPESPRCAVTDAATAIRAARIASKLSPDAILITADSDDACPAISAPKISAELRAEGLGVPVALVLFYREFETLAISVADKLGGRNLSENGRTIASIRPNPVLLSDPESRRDAKGWVGQELLGASYKPTVHQLPLTRALDISELREAGLSSFRRLESALIFLAREVQSGGTGTYP